MHQSSWSMPFGAATAGGKTRFRLWAPALEHVEIEIEAGERQPMHQAGNGWFETTLPCPAGSAYRFIAPSGMAFPDPASRRQKGGVHGWSVVVDPEAYAWMTENWFGRPWHEAVIYELHPGLMGGFNGIREHLSELAELGVTAIELMPIADFPGSRNWGYDGVLPFAPSGAYGTPEELKALVDEAHRLQLMVLLDVVYNHFGPDGNYLHAYAPDFFHTDRPTPWGPAMAFDEPVVADFFTQNALYWLNEFRLDGLRLDAVHAILPREAVPALGWTIRAALDEERHIHLVVENERNDAALLRGPFDAQWNDDIHHCLHVLMTGESEAYYRDYYAAPARQLARCLAEGFAYQGERSANLDEPRGTSSGDLPTTAFVAFVQNHDQIGNRAMGDRLTALAHPDALRAAVALTLLCPQIPMIFMGEETGSRSPFLFFTDHNPELGDAVREGRRSEFRNFAAFRDEQSRARIPDPNDERTYEASRPQPAEDGFDWRGFYRQLLTIRHTEIIPRLKGARSLDAKALGDDAVIASWTMGDGAVLTLAFNAGERQVALENVVTGEVLFGQTAADLASIPARTTLFWLARP